MDLKIFIVIRDERIFFSSLVCEIFSVLGMDILSTFIVVIIFPVIRIAPCLVIPVIIVDPGIPFWFESVDINIVGEFRAIIPFNPGVGRFVKVIIGFSSGGVLIFEILRVGFMDLGSAVVGVIF
jgi:hypothetical protein